MSPVIWNNVNLGPPNPSKLAKPVNYEFSESSEFEEEQGDAISAPTVLFINEDTLSKCPQVETVFRNGTRIRAI
jgi:hypothetical protein